MAQEQREARLLEAAQRMPENIETMMRVKRGEITLDEARVIIANDQGYRSQPGADAATKKDSE